MPQVVDAVSVPVIAAGGIADGRGLAAALALGAGAAQIGTAFVASPESAAPAFYREALAGADAERTTITRAFTGRPARTLRNRTTAAIGAQLAYPAQMSLTAACGDARPEFAPMFSGQAAQAGARAPAAEVVASVDRGGRAHAEGSHRRLIRAARYGPSRMRRLALLVTLAALAAVPAMPAAAQAAKCNGVPKKGRLLPFPNDYAQTKRDDARRPGGASHSCARRCRPTAAARRSTRASGTATTASARASRSPSTCRSSARRPSSGARGSCRSTTSPATAAEAAAAPARREARASAGSCWGELDARRRPAKTRNLIIHPAKNLVPRAPLRGGAPQPGPARAARARGGPPRGR